MKTIIILFLIYSLSGTLLHFLFKWSKSSIVIGIISSVNESVWEHIKLLLTPIFVVNSVMYLFGYKTNTLFILFIQLVLAIFLIIMFYYIKEFIFKDKYGFINIISFYVTCLFISIVTYYVRYVSVNTTIYIISVIGSIIIFIMYLTFTIFPPKLKIFFDPITKSYGINGYVNKSV